MAFPIFSPRCGATILLLVVLALDAENIRAEEAPSPDPWQRAISPWTWLFPRDHGAHPDFKTEWWYFTGNLQDAQHHRYGYQLTLFRQGIQFTPVQKQSRWALRDFYFGHFTISDIDRNEFHVQERVSRGALGGAKAEVGKMDVALGPWTIQQGPGEAIHLHAQEPDIGIDFQETPLKPLILEGVGGLSRKADGVGEASYYYSYPRLSTTGQLRLGEHPTSVSGLSWFDHEFSTSSLGANQVGWDWFCLQLDDNQEIMLYAMRDKSGAIDPTSEGTWINADGHAQRLPPGSFTITPLGHWHSPRSSATYPAGWHITIPSHQADLTVAPAMADQELHLTKMGALDYWEGACSNRGTVAGRAVTGVGYTELTGYSGALQIGLK
jgi:predicted secreted hydrolase